VLGLLIAFHQQRGLVFSVGIGAWLIAQWVLDRLHGTARSVGTLGLQLVALVGGVLTVIVPLIVGVAAWAGLGPLWECLVIHPITNYRAALHTSWGNAWGARDPMTRVIQAASFALISTAAIALILCWRRNAPEAARREVFLTIAGATSLLSMAYFPDIVHLALIAPLFLVMAGGLVQRGLNVLPARANRMAGTILAAAVVGIVAVKAYDRAAQMRDRYSVPYDSAFGHVDLTAGRGNKETWLYDSLRALVETTPDRMLYVHPNASYTNLLVDARNPTRYDLVWAPVYTRPAQMDELIASLREKEVPYILWITRSPKPVPGDLVTQFILAHYEQVRLPAAQRAQVQVPDPMDGLLWKIKPTPERDATHDS